MELRHLRYFSAVAQMLSFSKAAVQLGISQPGLSHQIRQLENEIGAPLFDRFGRKIRLTSAGRLFLSHANSTLQAADYAKAEMAEFLGMETGVLRIGAIQSFNTYLVPPVVAEFRRKAPKVKVQMFEMTGPDLEAQLISGDLDVGIGFAPPDNELIAGEILFEEALFGAVDRSRTKKLPTEMCLKDIAKLPLALFTQPMFTRRLFDASLAEIGTAVVPELEANSIECLLRAIPNSDLCAILPERVVAHHPELAMIRIISPTPIRTAALLRCRGAWRPKFVGIFEKLISGWPLDK